MLVLFTQEEVSIKITSWNLTFVPSLIHLHSIMGQNAALKPMKASFGPPIVALVKLHTVLHQNVKIPYLLALLIVNMNIVYTLLKLDICLVNKMAIITLNFLTMLKLIVLFMWNVQEESVFGGTIAIVIGGLDLVKTLAEMLDMLTLMRTTPAHLDRHGEEVGLINLFEEDVQYQWFLPQLELKGLKIWVAQPASMPSSGMEDTSSNVGLCTGASGSHVKETTDPFFTNVNRICPL